MKSVLLRAGYTMDPDEVKVPKEAYDWVAPDPNIEKGGPTFNKVDNLGGWSILSYHPVFAYGLQGGQYKAHCLPAGCHTIPPN